MIRNYDVACVYAKPYYDTRRSLRMGCSHQFVTPRRPVRRLRQRFTIAQADANRERNRLIGLRYRAKMGTPGDKSCA